MIDLSPDRDPADLVDALYAAREAGRKDLQRQVEQLTEHSSPTVREEAVALLLVRWRCASFRDQARRLLARDFDHGVRARVAFGLATISTGTQRVADAQLLAEVFAAKHSEAHLKCACFEALRWMVSRPTIVELDDTDPQAVTALLAEIAGQ
jgi:hypothetical protein